jgi:siroheme decarboxylase
MDLGPDDRRLLAAIANGLPLTPRPYDAVGAELGMSGQAVRERLGAMLDSGAIKRLGVIVRHHELGYRANAMAVWDVVDDKVGAAGKAMAEFPFVSLCYSRARRPPDWPYNLYCMVHGRDRAAVLAQIAELNRDLGLGDRPHAVLFSRRRFKQRGARYGGAKAGAAAAGAAA